MHLRAADRCRACATGWVTALVLASLAGCHGMDSYLDPSVIGRWEATPTSTPIIERISSIEDMADGFVEYTEPTSEDLVPVVEAYTVGPGDGLTILADDLVRPGQREQYQVIIDPRGFVDIPQLGEVYLDGLTVEMARRRLEETARPLVRDPLIQVTVSSARQQTFNVIGSVAGPGSYLVPEANYRLLEALAAAGGFPENAQYVYVIRQIPLTDAAAGRTFDPQPSGMAPTPTSAGGSDFVDLVDEAMGGEGGGSPGVISAWGQDSPPIDLVDDGAAPSLGGQSTGGNWAYLNGRWVQVAGSAPTSGGDQALVTQRVIRIAVQRLIEGDARYNIVIRPGDMIRVPMAGDGLVYLAGQINRPGVITIPASGLTLTRAVTAGGGLAPTAIPSRTDLTRKLGPDRQATITLDLRAIFEGSQPDVLLKPDDHVNIGTTFWALPLAVMRNGFRFTYGFGFLLDRNFGNDVFGPPPTERSGF